MDLGIGETPVGAKIDARELAAIARHDRLQDALPVIGAGNIAGTQHASFQIAELCLFQGENVWLLRQRWGIPTVKINGTDANPARWPDGTYSIQGAAVALDVMSQTIFKYLKRGLLIGRQLTKGEP